MSAARTGPGVPDDLQLALQAAIAKDARGPVVLDVHEVSGYTDWLVMLSGRSDRHVRAITEAITTALASRGRRMHGSEGFEHHLWDLLDYEDFVVHVFYHPVRAHYDLESMWSDAPRLDLGLPAEVMDTAELDGLEAPAVMPDFRGEHTFGGFADEFADDVGDETPDDGDGGDLDDEGPDPDEAEPEHDWDDELPPGDQDDEPAATPPKGPRHD